VPKRSLETERAAMVTAGGQASNCIVAFTRRARPFARAHGPRLNRGRKLMKGKYQLLIAMVAGAGVGAAAVQGLHAQARPKAYLVTETQILDAAAAIAVGQKLQGVIRASGGRTIISNRGKITPVAGDAPVRFGVNHPGFAGGSNS
jgi:hypothetical protein